MVDEKALTPSVRRLKTRSQRRASATRKSLLHSALKLFCEKGLDATTIEEITELADLGKGTFYRYFSSREEVFLELVDDVVSRLVASLRAPVRKPCTLEEVLNHILDTHAAFFLKDPSDFLLLFQGRLFVRLQREVAEDLEEPYLRYLKEIESQILAAMPGGADAGRVHRLAFATAGFVSGFFSFAMIGFPSEEVERSFQPLRQAFVTASATFLSAGTLDSGAMKASPGQPLQSAATPQGSEQ